MTRASASCTPLTLAVLLQSMKQEPPLDAKCRDKFLVQSVPIPADKDFSSVQEIVSHSTTLSLPLLTRGHL